METLKHLSILLLLIVNLLARSSVADCTCRQDNQVFICSGCDIFPDIDEEVLHLVLANNSLTEISEMKFTKLRTLDLSYNKITTIRNSVFENCTDLNEIKLNHNQISVINNQTFLGPTHLTVLDISYNNIKNVEDGEVFTAFKNSLQLLDMSHNHIVSFNPEVISNMRGLRNLDLSHNDINQTHEIRADGLTALEFLNLGHNGLQFIHKEAFKDMSSLITLDLSFNKLATLEAQSFHGLDRKLTVLLLNNNKLELINEFFVDLHQLKELNLNNNDIKFLTSNALGQSLEDFSLCNTGIEDVPMDFFSGARSLQHVKICNNRALTFIHPRAFDDLGQAVPNVNLSNNALTSLSLHLLSWQNVTSLDVQGNPWNCDCHLSWVNKTIPNTAKQMVCVTPKRFEAKSLFDVTPDSSACSRKPPSHFLYVTLTVFIVLTTVVVLMMCIIWQYGRSARKYMKMQTQQRQVPEGGMEFNNEGGSVQFRDDLQASVTSSDYQDDVRARDSMFPYKDLKEHTKDGDDTLFSIDDKDY